MTDSERYALLDFGDGRRLERFGPVCLDRPCPAADGFFRMAPRLWAEADAQFERIDADKERGAWSVRTELPDRWAVELGSLRFELKATDFGHMGLFPEQAENWAWLERVIREAGRPVRVLNLFGYTGGSTLAAAAAGAEVVHVDAARNVVAWARRNADLSGLAEAPVRWIAEDASKFVQRELQRGNRYDAVILDPPSYGHGPRGEVWRLAKDLPRLLAQCAALTGPELLFLLLTCHTPGFTAERLADMVEESFDGSCEAGELTIAAEDGRRLPSGVVVRWEQR